MSVVRRRCYRIAFYAPLKSPSHAVPSGDRHIARLFVHALQMQGHAVELAARFRSFEGNGNHIRQQRIERIGRALGQRLLRFYQHRAKGSTTSDSVASAAAPAPDCWLTYHSYHKAPDWIGLEVATRLNIPYVVAEASVAPAQQGGRWARGHERALQVVRAADCIININSTDRSGVLAARGTDQGVVELPLFLDPEPYRHASRKRATLASAHRLAVDVPWLLCAAMMRKGRKQRSFEVLAAALAGVTDLPWQLLIAGDGPASGAVRTAFDNAGIAQRVHFSGLLDQAALIDWLRAADWFVWPALGEPLGMAMLEAQAAGLPVIAGRGKGVASVVRDGDSGWLVDEAQTLNFCQSAAQGAGRSTKTQRNGA